MRNPIQCRIEDEIERACRSSIITNPDYLDDEQLTRERQFEVLTEIFNTQVRGPEISAICSHFAPIYQRGHPTHLSILGKTGTGKTITVMFFLDSFSSF